MMTAADEFPHEDEHKIDSEGNDWASSEPPVDDFGDHATEAATVSEGDDHHEAEQLGVTSTKKKSPMLIIVGAVVVLALIGGGAYWFLGDSPSHMTASDAQMLNAGVRPFTAPETPTDSSVAPKAAYGVPPAAATVPVAPAAQQAEAVAPSLAPVAPSMSPSTAMNPPAAPAASIAPATVPAPLVAAVTTNVASATDMAATHAMAANDDARLNALSMRLDDVQKSLGQATQQLSQISDKLAAGLSGGADASTSERLTKIEQKLIQLEQHKTVSSHHSSSLAANDLYDTKPLITRHKIAHAKGVRHASAPMKASAPWVLRAATPDEAWLAKTEESRELHPVHIGDQVAGIGKVTSIQQVGDSWVVQGTAGSLR